MKINTESTILFISHYAISTKLHCYKYKLTKPGSGGFLATPMLKQVLNSAIKCLQEQELEKNCSKKNYAGTSIEKIQYLFLHNYNIVPT